MILLIYKIFSPILCFLTLCFYILLFIWLPTSYIIITKYYIINV